MEAGIYIRVSTTQQEDGTSLGTQLDHWQLAWATP